ncbi:hypothetical protein ACQP0C_01495 [Nocardia sp. CA-129566]|uniref:hypothetical protein n=1 Tax=Nocardia sp. CA-129566 TaxID=3239976 RepID=UPI003D992EAB
MRPGDFDEAQLEREPDSRARQLDPVRLLVRARLRHRAEVGLQVIASGAVGGTADRVDRECGSE